MDYGFHATIKGPFETAVQRVLDALKAEGFGVLSDIDLQKAMKEKLGKEMLPHRILGACNPPLAYKALQAEANIGLLLPCNVTVRQEDGGDIVVGFLNPDLMVQLTGSPKLKEVAEDASARLNRVREALQS
ncbi:hypothetical protein H6CHR_03620 [Variovorax sp. PBL-H6]|uniref:DUF302 domain-containing protein n=1 Tax=Variovorax sp. PBL-H6 TaxID=434009 RepID=UPI001317D92B|nr:DUF302 domain-containing protein [Variovorax sp. PBL-H6]VTU31544.1 hypothetical protein H6CHR_03620 [Variovorax sp. PBL-H6]